jgi:hypothetical protein
MDQNFNTVSEFIKSCYNLDRDKYSNFISDDCFISYYFNGKYNLCDKETYISKLNKGHFENTVKVKVDSIEIFNKGDLYETEEICYFTRNGLGKDESGPGVYEMQSYGKLKVLDGKIININYVFIKYKI